MFVLKCRGCHLDGHHTVLSRTGGAFPRACYVVPEDETKSPYDGGYFETCKHVFGPGVLMTEAAGEQVTHGGAPGVLDGG